MPGGSTKNLRGRQEVWNKLEGLPKMNGEDLAKIAEDDVKFKMWTVSSVSKLQSDVNWIKCLLAPSTLVAVIVALVELWRFKL
jgi:hypothetical protein